MRQGLVYKRKYVRVITKNVSSSVCQRLTSTSADPGLRYAFLCPVAQVGRFAAPLVGAYHSRKLEECLILEVA